MKKVYLEDLPKWGDGSPYRGKINWKKSIGYKVKFIYEDVEDKIEIVDIIKNKILIRYKNNIRLISIGQFGRCEIGVVINKISHEHKYYIGEIIDKVNSGLIEIKEHIRMGKKQEKGYIYICKICGNEDTIQESNVIQGCGCNVCAKKKILKGVNDLWTTHPHIAKLLKNSNDGYLVSGGSNKKLLFKCPDCGYERLVTVNDITSDGFSCTVCGDGISFPEKFMSNFLRQLNIDFKREKSFDWSQTKRYDFYIASLNYVIETHGIQHYEENKSNRARTFQEEQENDKLKEKLAKTNGINKYIVIDCRESNIEHIKNNILNSKLNTLFNLSNINWIECGEFALTSLVKRVCDKSAGKHPETGEPLNWMYYDDYLTMTLQSESKEVVNI